MHSIMWAPRRSPGSAGGSIPGLLGGFWGDQEVPPLQVSGRKANVCKHDMAALYNREMVLTLTLVDLAFDKGGPDAPQWGHASGPEKRLSFVNWVSEKKPQRYTIIQRVKRCSSELPNTAL